MSRLTREDWEVYGILRSVRGKKYAENWRHSRNKKNADYGIGLPRKDHEWRLVKEYGIDGYLIKRFVSGHMTAAEKARFEEDNWVHAPATAYDCTGKPFTSWISFHEVPEGTWVYHMISFDV